jgi:hypothetical protein
MAVLKYKNSEGQWVSLAAIGPTGPSGPSGATGTTGPKGDPGPTGPTGPAFDSASLNTTYVNVIGDTMTGALTINSALTVSGVATVNSLVSTFGASMGGSKVTNVGDGATGPTSKDAVNHSQMFAWVPHAIVLAPGAAVPAGTPVGTVIIRKI